MQAMAEATANLGPAKQRSVYLFTYSKFDSSQLSRAEFPDITVDACHSCCDPERLNGLLFNFITNMA